jgi:hypothetical protein
LLLNENSDFLANLGVHSALPQIFIGIFLLRVLSRNGIVIWRQHLSRERISRGKQHSHFFFTFRRAHGSVGNEDGDFDMITDGQGARCLNSGIYETSMQTIC